MRKTATFVRDLDDFNGDAKLYKVSPPVVNEEDDSLCTDHIIVSAVIAMFSGAETYIFPADSDGEIISYGELEGSFKGAMNHNRALKNAGYKIK